MQKGDVLSFTGGLAAGKTTITRGIARALGIQDAITSPTFCIVSEYSAPCLTLYHIDAYRLENGNDFEDLGLDADALEEGICVVEWGERVASALPKRTIRVNIEVAGNGDRLISIEGWSHNAIAFPEEERQEAK